MANLRKSGVPHICYYVFLLISSSLFCALCAPVDLTDAGEEEKDEEGLESGAYDQTEEGSTLEMVVYSRDMIDSFVRKIEDLKQHQIETLIYERETCSESIDDIGKSLAIFSSKNEFAGSLARALYGNLELMEALLTKIHGEEDDPSMKDRYQELMTHPELGIIGLVSFVGEFVPEADKNQTGSVELGGCVSRAHCHCRDFAVVDFVHELALTVQKSLS